MALADMRDDKAVLSWLASLKKKKVLIFHPTYVNTHIFTFLVDNICRNSQSISKQLSIEIDFHPFDWTKTIAPSLSQELKRHSDNYDFILHFGSAEKYDVFLEVFNELNTTGFYSIYKDTCHHSDFFFRFIFFENKINVDRIWRFSKRYYNNPRFYGGLPYLSKLVSLLLSRGYRSFHVSSDSGEEAKSLVQKLLHEEYGFAFKLLPLNVNGLNQKANEQLGLSVKGGQQSHEEIRRQIDKISDSLTFVVPPKKKWTSATQIFLIYKSEVSVELAENLKLLCERFSSFLFAQLSKDNLDKEHEEIVSNIHSRFTEESISNFLREADFKSSEHLRTAIELTDNQFIKSLRQYIPTAKLKTELVNVWRGKREIADFLQLIEEDAKSLYLQSYGDYLQCLKNHHYFGDSVETAHQDIPSDSNTLTENFKELYLYLTNLLSRVPNDNSLSLLRDGFCVLKCVMEYPDGIDVSKGSLLNKILRDNREFFSGLKGTIPAASFELLDFYDDLRIIADDLNHFITTGYLLNETIVFDCFPHLDLSEFEYLISFSLYRELLNNLVEKGSL